MCRRVYLWTIILHNYASDLHQVFVHVTYGRGSVILWRRSDTLCTSGFMNDVIFAHKPRLLDVAAQQKRGAHAALGSAIICYRPTNARDYFWALIFNFPGGNTGGGVCGL